MERVLISRQSLAKRWDYESTKPIEALEREGVLTRVPTISSPRYSLEEILKLENIGMNIDPLSPIERRRLENKVKKLEEERDYYKLKVENIKMQVI